MKSECYIGDGVYASFDGFAVTIWTDREENGRNWLVLEPLEFRTLQNFYTSAIEAAKEGEPNAT